MLYIKDGKTGSYSGWHVGEPLPLALTCQRVVEIQADCDELDVIIEGLRKYSSDRQRVMVPQHLRSIS